MGGIRHTCQKTTGQGSTVPVHVSRLRNFNDQTGWRRSGFSVHERRLQSQSSTTCRAQQSGGSFKPFGSDPKKEDAARKALQDMFKGKSDTLAAFDPDDRGGGGGGKGQGPGGGGGRGGAGWSMPDWRGSLSGLFARFGDLGKALQAILAFAAIMLAFCYLGTATSLVTGGFTKVLRWVLRLDARKAPPRKARQPVIAAEPPDVAHAHLGSFERSVMQKYGPTPAIAQGADE